MTTSSWAPTAADIVAALREMYLPAGAIASGTDEWSMLTEVPSTGSPAHRAPDGDTGWSPVRREREKVRSIDVLLVHNWRSGKVPYERIAVEVKISRGDFRRDTDAKRAPWQALTHRFAYAVPEGLITPAEVPAGCWLIEVAQDPCDGVSTGHKHAPRRVHWNRAVKGAWVLDPATPYELVSFLTREACRAKETIRTADDDTAGAGPVGAKVADDLRRARNRVHALEARESANRDRYANLLALVAPLLPQDCADCGAPIRPVVPARYGSGEWAHKDQQTGSACARARAAAGRGWASAVEPATVRTERERAHAETVRANRERDAWVRGRDPQDPPNT